MTGIVAALAQVPQSALLVPAAASIAQLKWRWIFTGNRQATDVEMFDLAGRGPDGSMRFLWNFVWKQ